MAKIRYGKWGCWIPPAAGVLFSLLALTTAQPPGFLSIKCGGKTNHTDENNIKWITDAGYIDVGETADIGNVKEKALGSSLDSLRFFPKPLSKSCYQLPVPPNMPYLLRLWFAIGNYTGFQSSASFAYSFETVDMLATENFTVDSRVYDERIFVTSGTVMYVCLIRTSENDDPFITGIELRSLRDGMYAQAKLGTMLFLKFRVDAGGGRYSMVRYPDDNFDRIWTPDLYIDNTNPYLLPTITSERPISTNNTKELPPLLVMQTAWVVNSSDGVQFSLGSSEGTKALLETMNNSNYLPLKFNRK